MSMEVAMPTARERRERRDKLMRPPGGRDSSEREIMSHRELRLLERERDALRAQIDKQKDLEASIAAMTASIEREREQWQKAQDAWTKMLTNRGAAATRIMADSCEYFKVDPLAIFGKSRQAFICYVRHIVVYLCCDMTKKSFSEVGRFLGGRDHTTILHSREKITRLLASGDPKLTADIAAIRQSLGLT